MNQATLDSLVDAVCGLVVLLSAQFLRKNFGPGPTLLAASGPSDGYECNGQLFHVEIPEDDQQPSGMTSTGEP